ncbi:alpha/beta hydrolase [Phycicoccus sp. SLBN-51]|uniref:alpha/beta fold hydrolase n=1 Tax=Phycicoccus sp. SLBN-51 TaxID=2768447 RepID=UPI00117141DA|nr:alpha/beta hydrolase [Phycicoccus sp. SLBN-51]TQJ51708.1 pimeloyl-ACP methyl ester carboxylesterase [Phycicoccus sp. SLBN-51]
MGDPSDNPRASTPTGSEWQTDLPELPGVSHEFITLPRGLRMHVATAGSPQASPVVLLHGFPQNWWEWRKVIQPLAEGYRVIAPDLRGSGWTDAPHDGYTAQDLVSDVLALLDTLGLGRVGLVAHDFSAFVGFRLCYDHPDRVAAFVALAPHPYLRFSPRMLAGVPQLWFQPVVATPGLGPRALRGDRLPRHLLAGFVTARDSMTAQDLRTFIGRLHADGHPEAGSALYRRLILPEMARLVAGTYRKRHLTVPTVSVMGGADPGVHARMLDVPAGVADDLVGHIVDGAAHFIADDRPDAVVTHARQLFDRVLSPGKAGR